MNAPTVGVSAGERAPGRRSAELRVWLGLAFAAAVFVGLGMVGDRWLPAAGDPLEPPWFRSADALFQAVRGLGDAGRTQHRLGVLVLDTAIPLAYGWALYRAAVFYLDALRAPARLRRLRWIPVAAMLCDFAENAFIVTLLNAHPGEPRAAAAALLAFSWTKWGLLAVSVLGVLVGFVLMRARRTGHPV